MGFDEDLDDAAKTALRQMITLIGERMGLGREDAYMFCSLAVDMRVTQLVDGNKGIHAMLPKRYASMMRSDAAELESNAPDRAQSRSCAIFGSIDDARGDDDARFRQMLGGGGEPRRRRGRRVFLWGQDDRRLLPAGLHVAPAVAQEHRVLRDDRGGRSGRAAGRASAAARPTPRQPRGISRRSRRPARCCAAARRCRASANSPTRRQSAAFIFTGCSSRSPARRRATMPAPTGSADLAQQARCRARR